MEGLTRPSGDADMDVAAGGHSSARRVCPVCGSVSHTQALSARDHLYGNEGVFFIDRCDACGLGMQHPMPTEEQLAAFYPSNYACHAWREPCRDWVVALKRLLMCDPAPREPWLGRTGRMLDVGCGAGSALVVFRRRGWEAIGLEPDERAVLVGRGHGLHIEHGTLETVEFPAGSFHYVRMDHSFEHMPRPIESLQIVRRLLCPGGTLFLAVPEFESTTRRWFGEYWWFLGLPVHTYQYSRATLVRLLERAGFDVKKTRVRPHLGGTLGSITLLLEQSRWLSRCRIDLMKYSLCRLLGQWVSGLIALFGTGDVVEVTAVRPLGGEAP